MESPDAFFGAHWDPEQQWQVAQASCLWCRTGILPVGAGWKPALPDRRFMQSLDANLGAHHDLEPRRRD